MNKIEKIYVGIKPECKELPKPFPLEGGLSLFEDEYGWYFKHGELTPTFDE